MLIKGYKYFVSPLFGHSCRFLPTCSEYSIDALREFGLIKGIFKSIKRILSCHPIKFFSKFISDGKIKPKRMTRS